MNDITRIEQEKIVIAEQKSRARLTSRRIGFEVRTGIPSRDGHDGSLEVPDLAFIVSLLKSPKAKAVLDRGEPFEFFLPNPSGGVGWAGVNITITGVSQAQRAKAQCVPIATDRGNGYSGNPAGPLQPGDFGVHSHPNTAKLLTLAADRLIARRGSGDRRG